jgi:hypothetical protein
VNAPRLAVYNWTQSEGFFLYMKVKAEGIKPIKEPEQEPIK